MEVMALWLAVVFGAVILAGATAYVLAHRYPDPPGCCVCGRPFTDDSTRAAEHRDDHGNALCADCWSTP
jgi:hypothetical protein